jgi:hypothetical protein
MAIELIRQPTRQKDGNRKMSRPSDVLLCEMDLPLRRTFYPLGFAVEIVTNHPDVLEAANDSFGHRRLRHSGPSLEVRVGISKGAGPGCPPEPTRREYNHLYSLVADTENQALLDLKTHTSFVWLNTSALKNRLYFRYNFLEKVVYLLLGSSVVTDIHAACVNKNGKGILLCGDSGAGKSTLAYACARAGWTYISDDTSYLINGSDPLRVIGHSHRMRFRPTAQALFPELADRKLTPRMEGKASIEVSVSEFGQIVTAIETNVNAVVYLNRQLSGPGRLVRLPEGTATKRMRKELYSAGEIRAKHEKLLEMFSGIPTFALHYREFDQAIQQLDRLAWSARINLNAPTL